MSYCRACLSEGSDGQTDRRTDRCWDGCQHISDSLWPRAGTAGRDEGCAEQGLQLGAGKGCEECRR